MAWTMSFCQMVLPRAEKNNRIKALTLRAGGDIIPKNEVRTG
jgi:hypothetical protein